MRNQQQTRKIKNSDSISFLSPGNWVFHPEIVDKVYAGRYDEIMPVCAEIVTTYNCSNRCGFCGYRDVKVCEGCWERNYFRDTDSHMPSFDYLKKLLDKLIEGEVKGFIFTGGGEPFMFRGLEEAVGYSTLKGVDCVVYTNGNSCSKQRLERLIEANPLLVRLSLNAGTNEVYNKMHDPLNSNGAFQRVLASIETLALGSLRNPNMSFGVSVVVNEINQDDLVNAALRVREIAEKTGGGINFMSYRPAFDYYSSKQIGVDVLEKTFEIVERDVKKALEGTGVRVINIESRYEALKSDTRDYKLCRTTGICAELIPSGDLCLCCDRNCNRKYIIGNLHNQTLKEIYYSSRRIELVRQISDGCKPSCPPACKTHEINRQFQRIEEMRAAGKIQQIIDEINSKRHSTPPKMKNFP